MPKSYRVTPDYYEFVPWADRIWYVPWSQAVSHDYPLRDGWSGVLWLEANCDEPVFSGRGATGEAGFYLAADGTAALSAGTVRGLLRSWLEVATFSRCAILKTSNKIVRNLSQLPTCHSATPPPNQADFVETVFGGIYDKRLSRGRLSFSDLRLDAPERPPPVSYAPPLHSPHLNPLYPEKYAKAEAKRYPVRAAGGIDFTPNKKFAFISLDAPTTWSGPVRLHNMRPEEIAGVIWAATLGGNPDRFHLVGRGKPYGFGRVQFKIHWAKTELRPNAAYEAPLAAEQAQTQAAGWTSKFTTPLNSFAQKHWKLDWWQTQQMKCLMQLATPRP